MKRRHDMPFGAAPDDRGGVRFALWAPAAHGVDLEIEGRAGALTRSMDAGAAGWFALSVAEAQAGDRYRFRVDGFAVPDPAARYQPGDVHGWSEIVDPAAHDWRDGDWHGRPWHETVLYELHVGTFSSEGTYAGAVRHLDHVRDLGATAVELMPLAEAPGARNWGYDGVLPFAPESRYGRPEALKRFVEAAHERGLMVFLDVVFNHFGPEGNYLHRTAPQFFTERHATPWGAAIDFDAATRRPVREFFIHNALYWLEEYHFDGLRLDAVHAIHDDSDPDMLEELAAAVRERVRGRHVHLVLENDDNQARYLARDPAALPRYYTAQWNDDIHHALHVLTTGESGGYYADYADDALGRLGRCLAEGFAYQGEASRHRDGQTRGTPSGHLPPTAFVSFLQNHDQVGNRARGERIGALATREALRAATAIYLLAPSPPLLFMGEEWGAPEPFPFFCDFGPELAEAVREGRRREFARFPEFSDPAALGTLPDPFDPATMQSARLDWRRLREAEHAAWLDHYRRLLDIRRREIVPLLPEIERGTAAYRRTGAALEVSWTFGDGRRLQTVIAPRGVPNDALSLAERGRALFATHTIEAAAGTTPAVPPWFVGWFLGHAAP